MPVIKKLISSLIIKCSIRVSDCVVQLCSDWLSLRVQLGLTLKHARHNPLCDECDCVDKLLVLLSDSDLIMPDKQLCSIKTLTVSTVCRSFVCLLAFSLLFDPAPIEVVVFFGDVHTLHPIRKGKPHNEAGSVIQLNEAIKVRSWLWLLEVK